MSYHTDDTICAVATAFGGAARGIVRISGPDALNIVGKLVKPHGGVDLKATRGATALPFDVEVEVAVSCRAIPCDAFLWPTSQSYTREPVAELHTIGSSPVLEALVDAACHGGARLAEPGEFTLRAFLAGRVDLTQAEAILGVIDAQDDEHLAAALTQLAGGLARPLHKLRENLLQLLAELEAGLDFVEDNIRFIPEAEVVDRIKSAA